jgi:hypothetical protein
MSRGSEPAEISYTEIVTESDMAICFKDGPDKFWIPKSVIEEHDEEDKIVCVAAWFAEKEGLV